MITANRRTYEKTLSFFKSKQTLLAFAIMLIGIIFIFFLYDKPYSLFVWMILVAIFYKYWEDKDKMYWFFIYGNLIFHMIIMENLVIYFTGSLSYNFYNMFWLVPHWLPIAYFNSLIFTIIHYRLYKELRRDDDDDKNKK